MARDAGRPGCAENEKRSSPTAAACSSVHNLASTGDLGASLSLSLALSLSLSLSSLPLSDFVILSNLYLSTMFSLVIQLVISSIAPQAFAHESRNAESRVRAAAPARVRCSPRDAWQYLVREAATTRVSVRSRSRVRGRGCPRSIYSSACARTRYNNRACEASADTYRFGANVPPCTHQKLGCLGSSSGRV